LSRAKEKPQQFVLLFVIFKNLPRVNNSPTGENSPNLVTLSVMDTGCHAHWLPFFSVEGCFGARKPVMKIFLSFHHTKKGQLDKQ
jgi:hypothetical protein